MSASVVKTDWSTVAEFIIGRKPLTLIKHNDLPSWRVGFFGESEKRGEVFSSVFFLKTNEVDWAGHLGYSRLFQVSKIGTEPDMRTLGSVSYTHLTLPTIYSV